MPQQRLLTTITASLLGLLCTSIHSVVGWQRWRSLLSSVQTARHSKLSVIPGLIVYEYVDSSAILCEVGWQRSRSLLSSVQRARHNYLSVIPGLIVYEYAIVQLTLCGGWQAC
ncbi:hypothetical protein J6590_087681 [Homalodisca vitripennis]|nr:hypothetical protein J6590_087681 [Homalodisca vitripennis]